jgi:lipoprotein-releasing system permease protein
LAVDLGGGFYVSDWSRSHENIFRSIQTTKGILRVLLMLVLAVAAFNIVASLMLMVRNKHREIAILRTQGLAPLSVARVFVWQGCGIALWGVVIGLSVGLILCHYLTTCVWWIEHQLGVLLVDPKVYSIDELPVAVHIEDAIIIGVSALVLGILATIVPAITAGRLVPAEILRHD